MQFEDTGIALVNDVTKGLREAWEWAQRRPEALKWCVVSGSVLFSAFVGMCLRQNVTTPSQLLILLPAVLLSGLYFGIFAGTVAALSGALLTTLWKISPTSSHFAPDIVSLGLYVIACGIVLGLCHAQENQRRQLVDLAERLENKVHERTADLESANQDLTEFCYSISHDLSAPMRSIVSSSKVLLEEVGPHLDQDSKLKLRGMASSAKKLACWVDDLLHYAKLGMTEVKPEWVNVTQIVDEIVTRLGEEHWNFSSVTMRVHPNLVTTGDRFLVRMALLNVLENAFKYAKRDCPLVIEVGERISKNRTFIAIRDNGIGFEPQYAKKVFEPFQRLHRDEEYPGSGIGLAITKRIVERHGGEIIADASPMTGATFLLRFGPGKPGASGLHTNSISEPLDQNS